MYTSSAISNLKTDIAVIGGGIMGLVAALELQKAGRQVMLFEAKEIGGGASGKSSGFLTPDSEMELSDLCATFGDDNARSAWGFAQSGIAILKENSQSSSLPAGQVSGQVGNQVSSTAIDWQAQPSLFIARDKAGLRKVQEEADCYTRLGFAHELLTATQLPQYLGAEKYLGAIRAGGTYGCNSLALCRNLAQNFITAGGKIFENSPIIKLSSQSLSGNNFQTNFNTALICADYSLTALGVWKPLLYHAQAFLTITDPLPQSVQSALFPNGPHLCWDTDLIYQYYRLTGDGRLLLGGANLFYTYLPALEFGPGVQGHLGRYLKKHFPRFDWVPKTRWSGLIGVSRDFLPICGQLADRQNIFAGGGAAGLPWAAAVGSRLAKLAQGIQPIDHLTPLFSPTRSFPLGQSLALLPKPLRFALSHGYVKYFR